MKKIWKVLVIVLCVGMLGGCGSNQNIASTETDLEERETERASDIMNESEKQQDIQEMSSEENTSDDLAMVESWIAEASDNIKVSESILPDGKILNIAVGSTVSGEKLGRALGQLLQQEWFTYDYIISNFWTDGKLGGTQMVECANMNIESKEWGQSEKQNTKDGSSNDETYKLSPGQYSVGKDIPAGSYNVTKTDGIGSLFVKGDDGNIEKLISDAYNNLVLNEGETLDIGTSAIYEFVPVS